MSIRTALLVVLAMVALPLRTPAAHADVLHVGRDRRIECVVEETLDDRYMIRTGFGTMGIPKTGVRRVEYGSAAENADLIAAWEPNAKAEPLPAGRVTDVTDRDFANAVLRAHQPVLVEFHATWCLPCKIQAPILSDLAKEFRNTIRFGKLDVDRNPLAAELYEIRSLPTLVLFKDGRPVDGLVGLNRADDMRRFLRSAGS